MCKNYSINLPIRKQPVEHKVELYKALLAASKAYPKIPKTQRGAFGKFTPLEDLYDILRPVLSTHDLIITHNITQEAEAPRVLITRIIHAPSGAYLEDTRLLISAKQDNQGWGAAETYAKRYALRALLAVDTGEDDDDGDREQSHLAGPIRDKLKETLRSAENGRWILERIKESNRVASIDDLNPKQLQGALAFAEKTKKPT